MPTIPGSPDDIKVGRVVKETPILMKGEMIRAYKARIKNQTRRLNGLEGLNSDPNFWAFAGQQLNGVYVFIGDGIK